MQRILITGGCGFIGAHVARQLVARGLEITVLDNLHYGSVSNLEEVRPHVTLVRHDLGFDSEDELADVLSGIDAVIHLAAEKHNQSRDDPGRVIRSNVEGTCSLYTLAAKAGVKRIVYSSSLYAYGRYSRPACVETDPTNPATVYGMSKLAGEHLCRHVKRRYGIPFSALRFYFVYGPRQFAGTGYRSVIVKNFERILGGEPPVIFGDGEQALDYTYVDDVVESVIMALFSDDDGQIYNVASGDAVSINRLTAAMLEAADSKLEPVFGPADWTAGSWRAGDASKIAANLGWRPTTPLVEGLRKTYDWIRSS